jgi:creatinine amidohydrolase/Fe(II)-dependent formamide hydrolase-like protein
LPALFLPPQVVGLSTEHLAYPGTLSLSPATVIALWTEIGACVARAGVKKLLLLNGHGGNVAVMDIVARELRQHHGLLVYSSSWFSLPQPPEVQALFSAEEQRFGIHGGAVETSMMLHLAPATVRMEHAAQWRSSSQDRAARMQCWATARAPRWAGPCRTTTPQAPWAMPVRPAPTRATPWCWRRRAHWRSCSRKYTLCPRTHWFSDPSIANVSAPWPG